MGAERGAFLEAEAEAFVPAQPALASGHIQGPTAPLEKEAGERAKAEELSKPGLPDPQAPLVNEGRGSVEA